MAHLKVPAMGTTRDEQVGRRSSGRMWRVMNHLEERKDVHDVRADSDKPSVSPASDEAEAAENADDDESAGACIKRFHFPFP